MTKEDMVELMKASDALNAMDKLLEELTGLGYSGGKFKDIDCIYTVLKRHSHPAYSASASDAFWIVVDMTDKTPEERVDMLIAGP